jgi:O-antigen/teichoic acid export membrane protein
MLSIMKDDRVTGFYSSAYDLLFAFIFIPTIMNAAVFPRISYLAKSAFDKFKDVAYTLQRYFLMISVPLSIGLFFSSEFLIRIIYGNGFSDATVLFQIMTIALLFVFLNHIYASIFNAIDKQHVFTIFTFVCMLLNISMNYTLIPIMSAHGAVIATISTELLLSVLSIIAIYKHIGRPTKNFWSLNSRIILAGVIAIYAIALLPEFNQLLQSIVAVLIYTFTIFLLRVFTAGDRNYFAELTGK